MNSEIEVTLRLTGEISRLAFSPGDIVWLKLDDRYSEAQAMFSIAEHLRRLLRAEGHENQVIVSDSRMEILVITPDPPTNRPLRIEDSRTS